MVAKSQGSNLRDLRRVEFALQMWRGHATLFDRFADDTDRSAYESAISAGLHHLQRFSTMACLIAHYFDDRTPYSTDPASETVEAWVEVACASVPAGERLLRDVVADIVFWRRLCQLITAGS